jgi:hypothetical protein
VGGTLEAMIGSRKADQAALFYQCSLERQRVSANIKLAAIRREATAAIRESEERLRELNATLEQRVMDALAEKRLFAEIVEATDSSVQAVDKEFRFLAIIHFLPMTSTPPPVSAAAKQQHQNNYNKDQFHRKSP